MPTLRVSVAHQPKTPARSAWPAWNHGRPISSRIVPPKTSHPAGMTAGFREVVGIRT